MRFHYFDRIGRNSALDDSNYFRHDRFMTWTTDDWVRLGDQIRAARRSAGYKTASDFAEHLGARMSSKTYLEIEAGRLGKRKEFSRDSLSLLEDEFGWAPGVSRSILDGKRVDLYSGIEPPVNLKEDPWTRTNRDENYDSTFAWLDERVGKLERRIITIERQLREKEGTAHGNNADEKSVSEEAGDEPALPPVVTDAKGRGQSQP